MVLRFSRRKNIKLDISVAAAIHVPKHSVLAGQRHIACFRTREGDIVPWENHLLGKAAQKGEKYALLPNVSMFPILQSQTGLIDWAKVCYSNNVSILYAAPNVQKVFLVEAARVARLH